MADATKDNDSATPRTRRRNAAGFVYANSMTENKRSEPGNATAYITVDRKIVGKIFIVGDRDFVTSFIDEANDNLPNYVLYIDTLSEKRS